MVSTATQGHNSADLQLGRQDLGSHLSEEGEVEEARVWFSRLLHALFARRNV